MGDRSNLFSPKRLKTDCLAVLAMTFMAAALTTARAASTDSVTVTVRPNAYYAVTIDTGNVVMDLGTVDLNTATQTVRPATVTVQSTFATTDLKLRGSISSAVTPWTFDDDSTSSEPDKIAAWATFTSVQRSSVPAMAGDYFSGTAPAAVGSDVLSASDRYAGSSASDGTTDLFETNSGFDAKNMDALPPDPDPAAKSHLWLYFRLPSATSTGDLQNVTVTVTATAPN